MASRAQAKEEARRRRLAEEHAAQAQAQRRRRLQMVGGVVVIAIVIVAVLIAISSGNSSSSGIPTSKKQQTATVAAVSTLLGGIPESGNVLGNPKAPVTMTYYGDLECPICQEFTLQGGFSALVQNDVRSGKVKVVYSGLETATRDPSTFQTQQVAALSAGLQGRFWYYAELFYHEQGQEDTGYVTQAYLDKLAAQVPGLNLAEWQKDRQNPSLVSEVAAQERQGSAAGIQGTPTLIFTGPTGKKAQPSSAVPSYSDLESAIKQVA